MGTQFLSFPSSVTSWDCIAQRLRQSDVLRLRRGQRDLCLQLPAPDDRPTGVQYGIAGPVLGGDWVVAGGRAVPVSTKFGGGVHLKYLVVFGFQRDLLRPRGLEVLDQVAYCVPVRCP